MKNILVFVGTLVCVLALGFSACTSRLIPPSEEYLSPPEPEKVEYIAKPPNDLAELLFSSGISEQSKATTWSNAQGKWIVWVGKVHRVEPQLKPSRIVFLYEYETSPMSFDNGQFVVTVKFDLSWTQQLKQLTTGEFVYFRAKLVEYDSGLGSNLLMLEKGQLIHRDDIAAKLVDLAYSSYEQLDRLAADAKRIVEISDYFERKADLTLDVKRNLTKFALKLIHIELRDDTQLHEISLPAVRRKASLTKSEIEKNLEVRLAIMHSNTGIRRELELQDIERKIVSGERLVKIIEDEIKDLESIWEKDKRSAELDIVDLIPVAVNQLINVIIPDSGIIIGITTATADIMAEIVQRPLYDQVVVICQTYLGLIDEDMQYIRGAWLSYWLSW